MINIIKKDEALQRSNYMEMYWTGEHVEEPFKELVKWNSEIFRDEKSLALMDAIDGAVRVGEYGVVTPLGKSCITCLSSGCKAGLLMLYYNSVEIIPVVSCAIAGDNVWKWLAENTEITVATGLRSEIHIRQLQGEKTLDLWDKYIEEDVEGRALTPEKEPQAYEMHVAAGGGLRNRVVMEVEERLPFAEFAERFEENLDSWYEELFDGEDPPIFEEELEEYDTWKKARDYTVVNRISSMRREAGCRKLPVFWFWNQDGQPQMADPLTVKYPSVTEILYPEFMTGFYCYDRERDVSIDEMDDGRFTAVVFDTEEVFYSGDYYRWIWFAVEVDTKVKTLTLYDKEEAVEIFHKKMEEMI